MKFDIGDIRKYQGEDLIFLVGSPGSKWSQIHRILCEHPDINTTDWSEEKTWRILAKDVFGVVTNTGGHRGSYWGPGNMYGKGFDRLDKMTKEEIVSDCMDAYETWDKVKIIKSHWFAYNLEYLHSLFPKAKIALCYAGDIESFHWWHKQGGWGLGYADYSWYENDTKMLASIKEENSRILKFAIDRDLDFKVVTRSVLWEKVGLRKVKPITREEAVKLGLRSPKPAEIDLKTDDDPKVQIKFAIFDGNYVNNFYHVSPADTYLRKLKPEDK